MSKKQDVKSKIIQVKITGTELEIKTNVESQIEVSMLLRAASQHIIRDSKKEILGKLSEAIKRHFS